MLGYAFIYYSYSSFSRVSWAVLAESKPTKVAINATKLGAAKHLVPLCFILDPALALHAGIGDIFQAFALAFIGVIVIGSVLANYLIGIGRIALNRIPGLISGSGHCFWLCTFGYD